MISLIEKINEFGFGAFILCVTIGTLLIISIVKTSKEFLSVLGLKSERTLREQASEKRFEFIESKMVKLEEVIHDYKDEVYRKQQEYHEQSVNIRNGLVKEQNQLNESIKELKIMLVNKNINDMRWEILNFANSIMGGKEYNKEQYDHVLEIYKDYENVLAENNMENGRIDISMEFIKNHYTSLMESGFKQ